MGLLHLHAYIECRTASNPISVPIGQEAVGVPGCLGPYETLIRLVRHLPQYAVF